MQVVVDGLLTNFQTVGSGNKIVTLLHGWADAGKTFDSLSQQFVKEHPEYTAVLLDLPGFGSTQAPSGAWGLKEYAVFVSHFLQKKQYQSDLIIGHSNGGAIAIYGLSHGLLQTNGLILLGSAGIRESSSRNTALKVLSIPVKAGLSLAPKSVQQRIKRRAYDAIGSDYMVSEHMQDTFKQVVSYDVRHDAQQIQIPVQLLYGEHDTATPPRYGKIFASTMPSATLTIVPEATHFLHQEQVYVINTHITNFMQSL